MSENSWYHSWQMHCFYVADITPLSILDNDDGLRVEAEASLAPQPLNEAPIFYCFLSVDS